VRGFHREPERLPVARAARVEVRADFWVLQHRLQPRRVVPGAPVQVRLEKTHRCVFFLFSIERKGTDTENARSTLRNATPRAASADTTCSATVKLFGAFFSSSPNKSAARDSTAFRAQRNGDPDAKKVSRYIAWNRASCESE
jgi:hypothetical protein